MTDLQELYAERAAILEYEAGHPRSIAERLAADMLGIRPPAPPPPSAVATSDRRRAAPARPSRELRPDVTRVSRWAGERDDHGDPAEREDPRPGSYARAAAPIVPVPSSPPALPGPSRCRSCMASIVFAGTLGGKLAPFERDDDGEWVLDGAFARQVGKPSPQLELGAVAITAPRYTSHFARCPDAGTWRTSNKDRT